MTFLRSRATGLCGVSVVLVLSKVACAATLAISPTLIDVVTPGSAATAFKLRGGGETGTNIQVRVFRWRQHGGEDILEATDDVAVSPPFATLKPAIDYVIRVVRTSSAPVVGEESYRVLVDELPAPGTLSGSVSLAVRHSIPVFFRAPETKGPDLRWRADAKGGKLTLSVVNLGDRRLRVAGLRASDGHGRIVDFGAGLAGYALARGGRSWSTSVPAGGFDAATTRIEYISETGRQIDVVAPAPRAAAVPDAKL